MSHTITILHAEGCLGAPEAETVARGLAATRNDVSVQVVLVEDEAQAVTLLFRGSPTVLIDGIDIEPDSEIRLGGLAQPRPNSRSRWPDRAGGPSFIDRRCHARGRTLRPCCVAGCGQRPSGC
jgi:hypothetical protein